MLLLSNQAVTVGTAAATNKNDNLMFMNNSNNASNNQQTLYLIQRNVQPQQQLSQNQFQNFVSTQQGTTSSSNALSSSSSLNTNQIKLTTNQFDLNEMLFYWRNFRVQNLKNDLDIYLKQIDGQKALQNDLNNQFEYLQSTVSTLNTQNFDKTSYNIILEAFTNQLANLSNRLKITENLVVNLSTFFSNVIKQNEHMNGSAVDGNVNVSTAGRGRHSKASYSNQNNFYIPPYDLSNVGIPDESTEEVAKRVKEYMEISKISQRTFAESVLNMKQANFSFILSHPLSWQELTKSNKDKFLTMYLWLNDPDRMDKIGLIKPQIEQQIQSKYSFSSTFQSVKSNVKRKRLKLKATQIEQLNNLYDMNAYPSKKEISGIAFELNLPPQKVQTWFTHQRQINKS